MRDLGFIPYLFNFLALRYICNRTLSLSFDNFPFHLIVFLVDSSLVLEKDPEESESSRAFEMAKGKDRKIRQSRPFIRPALSFQSTCKKIKTTKDQTASSITLSYTYHRVRLGSALLNTKERSPPCVSVCVSSNAYTRAWYEKKE